MSISDKDLTKYEVPITAEKYYVTWEEIMQFVEEAKKHIPEGVTGIYGIPRGGLIPAVMLSHATGLKLLMEPEQGCLLVDDIVDTGSTLLEYGKPLIAIYCYINSKAKPTWFFKDKIKEWIVLPWELKPNQN